MEVTIRLLTCGDAEERIIAWSKSANTLHDGASKEIEILPIVELLELCELVKKQKSSLPLDLFRLALRAIQEQPIGRAEGVVLSLDQECIADSLFEREDHIVVGLWPSAILDEVPPFHSIRRLLLRPSIRNWWNGELYKESEENYTLVEC